MHCKQGVLVSVRLKLALKEKTYPHLPHKSEFQFLRSPTVNERGVGDKRSRLSRTSTLILV